MPAIAFVRLIAPGLLLAAAAALGAVELESAAHHIDAMVRGDPAKRAGDEALRAELELLRDDLADLVARLRKALGRSPRSPT